MYSGERISPGNLFHVTHQQSLVAYQLATTYTVGKRVLDVAFGEGYGSSLLSEHAASVVGVDYNAATVASANARYGKSTVRFVQGNLFELSAALSGETFDVVCCFQTIEHVADHDAFMQALMSVTKVGGTILVSTPNRTVFPSFNPHHIHEVDVPEFRELLERHFTTFKILGVFGSDAVMRYRQGKQKVGDMILKIDFLRAREWLPRGILTAIYGFVSFFIIKRISLWRHRQDVVQVTTKDFSVKDVNVSEALDLIAVATRDGGSTGKAGNSSNKPSHRSWIAWVALLLALFVPRMVGLNSFFIQDEQPWMDRSQIYAAALGHGDLTAAVQFPLSNHPAITLMTTVGPALNVYRWYEGLEGTYTDWSWPVKREAATVARYTWGLVCSTALLLLFLMVRRLRVFARQPWQAAVFIILFGLEPWIWGISRTVSVDVMMGIALVGSFIAGALAREQEKPIWLFLSGAWWAAAFVSKSPALIVAPFAFLLPVMMPWGRLHEIWKRAGIWLFGMYVAAVVIWPPFLIHPIQRLHDVLARDVLHATMQEAYLMPNTLAPFFLITLSAFAFVGCVLYVVVRALTWRREKWQLILFDVMLVAGLWHGTVLVYLQGDHARKNLPAVAILAAVGIMGWLLALRQLPATSRHTMRHGWSWGMGLVVLQLLLVGPYFPHVMTAHNFFLATPESNRLLVDIGNGSRLIADYIHTHDDSFRYATPMDSLLAPYLTREERDQMAELPEAGKLENLAGDISHVVVPMSFPARALFDRAGEQLAKEVSVLPPEAVLSVRDVPMFAVYRVPR